MRLSIDEALPAYLTARKAPDSVATLSRTLWPRFSKCCRAQGVEHLAELTREHVAAFQQALCWEPGPKGRLYAPQTVAASLRLVRHVLTWAHREGFSKTNPAAELKLGRVPQPQRRQLTGDHVEAVLAAPDRAQLNGLRDAVLFSVMSEAGLACHKAVALDLEDVSGLPLSQATRALLEAYLADVRSLWARSPRQTALFLTRYGKRIEPQTVRNSLVRAAQQAGLAEPVTLRMLSRSRRAPT